MKPQAEAATREPDELAALRERVSKLERIERELEARLRFETLVGKLSAKFIAVPASEVDRTIQAGLEEGVEFLGLDRGSLFEFFPDDDSLRVTHPYAAPGAEPLADTIVSAEFPWLSDLQPPDGEGVSAAQVAAGDRGSDEAAARLAAGDD